MRTPDVLGPSREAVPAEGLPGQGGAPRPEGLPRVPAPPAIKGRADRVSPAPPRPPLLRPAPLLLAVVVLAACASEVGDAAPPAARAATVARVGDAVLTEADLAEALGAGGVADSAAARRQVVEQWVRRELLVQAARAEGIDRDPDVRRLLAESERATLAAAALDRLAPGAPPTDADLRAAYEQERDDLVLTEPYVRVRHLRTGSREAAEAAQTLLNGAGGQAPSGADAAFAQAAQLYADDAPGALALAAETVPESRLADLDPALPGTVARLAPGGRAVVVGGAGGTVFHVVQVVARARAGTVPPFSVVRDDLAERLAIRLRRRQEARLLQSLRADAQAAGRLDLR